MKPEKRKSGYPPLTRKQIYNILQGPYTYESKKNFIDEFTGGKSPRIYFYFIDPPPPKEELEPDQPIPVESPKNHKFCRKERRKKEKKERIIGRKLWKQEKRLKEKKKKEKEEKKKKKKIKQKEEKKE